LRATVQRRVVRAGSDETLGGETVVKKVGGRRLGHVRHGQVTPKSLKRMFKRNKNLDVAKEGKGKKSKSAQKKIKVSHPRLESTEISAPWFRKKIRVSSCGPGWGIGEPENWGEGETRKSTVTGKWNVNTNYRKKL